MPVNFTGAYVQNFDSLASTGTSSTLPADWVILETGGNTSYTANDGASNTGDTYSYGTTGSTDRALGALQSGSLVPTFGASFTNTTGSPITSLRVSYTGEQWRLGALGRVDRLDFQYSTNASSLSTGTWTDVNTLDFTAPVTTGTVGALNGNSTANRSAVTTTITGLNIPAETTFWFRWQDFNATGADDGLAIDDFSLTLTTPQTFTVTNTNDSGAGSLREAIALANADPTTADTIRFGGVFTDGDFTNDTLTLTTGSLPIAGNVTIDGSGGNPITISGNNSTQVFRINSGTVALNALTLINGRDFGGGSISNQGTLTLNNSTLSGNSSIMGASGIYNFGTLSINNSTFSGNQGGGSIAGAIFNEGSATLSINNSTFSGNTGSTGAIFNGGTITYLSNSTFGGNTSVSTDRGSIFNNIFGNISVLKNNLFVENSNNTIPTATTASNNLSGTFASLGVDPVLRNNGGTTATHALLAGSSAINAGDNTGIPADVLDQDSDGNTTEPLPFDQRGTGFSRVIGGTVDVGAFEFQTVTPAVNLSISTNAGTEAGTTAITVTATASSTVSGNQTVSLGVSGTGITAGDYSLSNTTITIPDGQTTGTVTFTVVDDAIAEGSETATLTLSNPSSGIALGSTTTQNITITDNDTAGVNITQSGGSTNVTEGGATDTYTVVLTSQPTHDVTITLNPGSQLSTPTPLTFTAANWNVAQTVTVTAVNDFVAEGEHVGTIAHTSVSSDSNYNGITIAAVTATITDNDTAGVTITESGGSTTITEGGSTDTYTVVLTSQPTSDVTITLNNGSETNTNPTTLTFTTANWNVAQTVIVTAVNDAVAEGSHTATITHTATSSDSNYNGITIATVTANITDNDTAGVTITQSGGSTNVTEGGTTDTYAVVLNTPPTADVTITLNSGNQLSTNPTSLTFTTANWNVAQTVTVTAIDDLLTEGSHTGTITHTASSTDSFYNGIAIAAVTGTITDNDNPPTDISLTNTAIDENVAALTVGTFSTIDPDGGNFDYELVTGAGDRDNSAFEIFNNELRIKNSPDYETQSSYSIRVRTTDSSDLWTEKTFTIAVNDLNDAPVLLDTVVNLASTRLNAGAPIGTVGTLISQIADLTGGSGQNNIVDPDAGSVQGIAITAANTSNGTWFYSTDNGANWNNLGSVSESSSRLLAANPNTRLYFQPNTGYTGTLTDAITFRAWDQTSGTNGTLASTISTGNPIAFSTATDTASISVLRTNRIDFNGDGDTDILWWNVLNGRIGFWALNDTSQLYYELTAVVPLNSGWTPVGAGDFTKDGKTDILWRNRFTGENGYWEMDRNVFVAAHSIDQVPVDSGWDVVGVADFTNDGNADILWRNRNTGENGYWEMDGTTRVKAVGIQSVAPQLGWDIVGVGDFTGEGSADILWRNRNTGENGYWEMNGASLIQAHSIDPVPVSSGWQVAEVGDFNQDARADILWRNASDGQAGFWLMNGTVRTDIQNLLPTWEPASGWTIV